MRPLRLTLEAFGSYLDRQEIDFTSFTGHSIFLIHGPTGSGKTTILDGICYALYGETSGAYRPEKTVRSSFAPKGHKTVVEFDFALGDDEFRIVRSPTQEVPKTRGEGLTTIQAEAVMSIKRDGVYVPVFTKPSQVRAEVERRLGFRADQFRQVIMLPQGDFRRLLLASTTERQEILEKLFNASKYSALEDLLKTKASRLIDERKEHLRDIALHLHRCEAEDRTDLAASIEQARSDHAAMAEQISQLKLEIDRCTALIQAGQKLNEQLDCQAVLELNRQDLLSQAPTIEAKKSELALGQKALILAETERELAAAIRVHAARVQAKNDAEEQLQAQQKHHQQAANTYNQEEAAEPEREQLRRELDRLAELQPKVEEYHRELMAVTSMEASVAILAQRVTNQQEHLQQRQSTLKQAEAKLLELDSGEGTKLELKRQQLKAVQDRLDKSLKLQQEQQKLKKHTEELAARAAYLAEIQARYDEARGLLRVLQQAWNLGQAAILAHQLTDGQPCPVCGSTSHPMPATSVEDLPSEKQINDQQQAVETGEHELEAARTAWQRSQNTLHTLQSAVDLLRSDLGEATLDSLQQEQQTLNQQIRAIQVQIDSRERVAADVKNLKELVERTEKQLATASQEHDTQKAAFQQKKGTVDALANAIPTELRDIGVLKNQHRQLAETLRLRVERYQKAKRELDQSRIDLTRLEESLIGLEQQVNEDHQHKHDLERMLRERAAAEGFASLDQLQAAKREPQALERLQKEITIHSNQLHAVNEQLQQLATTTAGQDRVDLLPLMANRSQLEQEFQVQVNQQGSLNARIAERQRALDAIMDLEQKLARLESEYAVLGRVAEWVNGDNPYKMTLQRFVLGAFLDEVTFAATARLSEMSRGQYHLRSTIERQDGRSLGGLDLEIYDNNTGTCRHVNTLSGGEMFMASLSLALGLADVVQANAGGIRLDAMFIDEGFGTLDAETLDMVLKKLIELQSSGRLVGIISHVNELKEVIPAQIAVAKTASGSSCQVVIRA